MVGDQKWLDKQINKFKTERPVYESYSDLLDKLLKQARKEHAAQAIVQVRAKTLPSFAEKALRKVHKYDDPVNQLTDLCGARVITDTLEEVQSICSFIRATLVIDEPNSLDVFSRLKEEEFGYRSVHFVVQLDEAKILKFLYPDSEQEARMRETIRSIGERKAEIQVRTLLQHAWADIGHDRMYKTEIRVPKFWKRELHRTAALVEAADNAFSRTVRGLDAYQLNYGAYMGREKMTSEIETLTSVLKYDSNNAQLAHKIARLALALEDWDKAISVTEHYKDSDKAFLVHDYGLALFESGDKPAARKFLERTIELDVQNAEAHCDLGDTWFGEDDRTALQHYRTAFQLCPSDPRFLRSFLECKIRVDRNIRFLPLIRPSLEAAFEICRERISVGTYLPWAFYDIGLFSLLLEKPYESLSAYTKAVELSHSELPVEHALLALDLLGENIENAPPEVLTGLRWACRFLQGARMAKLLQIESKNEILLDELGQEIEVLEREKEEAGTLQDRKSRIDEITTELDKALARLSNEQVCAENVIDKIAPAKAELAALATPLTEDLSYLREGRPIVIVAGGCASEVKSLLSTFKDSLKRAFEDFGGIVVCGGTQSGISGMVGDLRMGESARRIGYLPFYTPPDVSTHDAYDILRTQDTKDFTPLEPIQIWLDLFTNGYKPEQVRVLGINGGFISAFEYRMAVAFGASVGILESSGRAATELAGDPDWTDSENLDRLPHDAMAIRAFVFPAQSSIPAELLEKAGQTVHEKYLAEIPNTRAEASLKPWAELPLDLKESNRQQVAYAEEMLRKVGFGVRPASRKKIKQPKFSEKEMAIMAEMEHGRWIVERLNSGWRFASTKDVEKKESPYLRPWSDLPDKIKDYDRTAVANLPSVLAEANLEVYRIKGN